MKHFLVFCIWSLWIIGATDCAFAKASSIKITTRILTEQQSTVETIYQRLDAFLEIPNASEALTFYQWLKKQSISSKEEQLAKVISLCNLGFYSQRDGNVSNATQFYAEGWNIYSTEQLSGFDILESCLKPLGNLYTQTNALSEAQQAIERYIFYAQEAGRTAIIPGGIANLSIVYQNQGNYEKAISILNEGLKRHPKHTDLLTNLATNLFAINRDQEALKIAQQSLILNPNQANIYKMRAQLYARKEQYPKAIRELQQAYSLQLQHPRTKTRDIAKTKLSLAEIYVKQNAVTPAKMELKNLYTLLLQKGKYPFEDTQDYPNFRQLYPENTLMDALDLHAHIALLESNYPSSLALYEQAAYVGDLLNTTQRDQQSRLIMQSNSKKRVESYLELAYNTYQTQKDRAILDKAFLLTQKATASIVSETYIQKKQRQPYQNDPLIIELEEREQKQAHLRVRSYEIQKEGIPDLLTYAAVLDSIDQNRFQIKTVQKELKSKYPALNEVNETTLIQVQEKAKKKGQTVVNYFMGTKATYQFVISGSKVTFNKLTSDQKSQTAFKQACIDYIGFYSDAGQINNDPTGYAKTAFDLYKKLQLPDADHLIIIPDSFLQFIPFDALLTKSHNGFQYEEMPYLLNRSQLSYVLSPMLYTQEDVAMTPNPLALGIFPVFEGTNLELTFSIDEANALKDSFDGQLLLRKEASVAAAFAKAGDHQILHFSTHASGGSLQTPAYLQLYDTQIPVQQLYGDQWQSDLVVLSACETGVGAIVSGEGAQSIARGFQYAGAQNIAFTLWQVNDKSTASLMSYYYQNLKSTLSRNGSLQLAKLTYLTDDSIPNSKKSPYYWAAFVYYGTTDIPQTSNSWLWWCGLGILALFLILLRKQKHGITA